MRPFEDFLPSNTPRYEFQSTEQSVQILHQEMSRLRGDRPRLGNPLNPFLIFVMDRRSFLSWQDSGESLLEHSGKIYDYPSSQLLVEMISPQHECAAGAFFRIVERWLDRAVKSPRGRLVPYLRTSVEAATWKKEPDLSWRATLARGRPEWPTFVVEVAWSEPRQKLKEDMTFWLTEPTSPVSIALTITVKEEKNEGQPSTKTIVIEKWKLKEESSDRVDSIDQIKIVQEPGVNPQVTGHLCLPLQDILYRPREANENDFILESTQMKNIADIIWPPDDPSM